ERHDLRGIAVALSAGVLAWRRPVFHDARRDPNNVRGYAAHADRRDKLWVYDLRTNQHFTLKQKPIRTSDFDEFVACYKPGRTHDRTETWTEADPDGRWRCYTYDELLKREKLNLDLFWIKDKSLTDTDALPPPDIIAAEIADDL